MEIFVKKMELFISNNNLDDYVSFLGKVAPEEMLNEYQSAHVMVISSLNEGMSIAALEAIACGVYVISTPVSGAAEMITENVTGNIVSFGNHTAISEMISLVQGKVMGEQNTTELDYLPLYRKQFSWENRTKEYLNYFRNFLM